MRLPVVLRAVSATLAVASALGSTVGAAVPVTKPVVIASLTTSTRATGFVVAKNGKLVGALLEGGQIALWTLPDGKPRSVINIGSRSVDAFAMSADGHWIGIGDHAGRYTVWNAASGAEKLNLEFQHYPAALGFSANGRLLAVAPMSQAVQIYDVKSGKRLFELGQPIGGSAAIAFSRDDKLFATADADTVVRIYDARTGKLLGRNEDFMLVPLAVDFSSDARYVIAAGGDKYVAMVDAATGRATRSFPKSADAIAYLEASPDGAWLATALMHSDATSLPNPVIVWAISSGAPVQSWLPPAPLLGSGWTADSRLLTATSTGTELKIWRVL